MPNRKPDPLKHCASCGAKMERKWFNGVLESMNCFLRRRHCGRQCMATAMLQEHITRSGHLVRARKHLKKACEQCGTSVRLGIHHKNRNWSDDSPDNLETLCSSCHTKLHLAAGDISRNLPPRPCRYCGKVGNVAVCSTCRSRIHSHGNPFTVLPKGRPRKIL